MAETHPHDLDLAARPVAPPAPPAAGARMVASSGKHRSRGLGCRPCYWYRPLSIGFPVSHWPAPGGSGAGTGISAAPHGLVVTGSATGTRVLPVSDAQVQARIVDALAQVSLRHSFVNTTAETLKGKYTFPIDARAAVNGFSVSIDGTEVVGVVKEKAEAKAEFDDAVRRGDGAYLVQESDESRDVFTLDVGSLPPGKRCDVTLSYVTVCDSEGDALRFVLPTAVAPRYGNGLVPHPSDPRSAPGPARGGMGGRIHRRRAGHAGALPAPQAVSSASITMPTSTTRSAAPLTYSLRLDVVVEQRLRLARVHSASHDVRVAQNDEYTADVSLINDASSGMDKDFVLTVHCDGVRAPHAWVEAAPNDAEALTSGASTSAVAAAAAGGAAASSSSLGAGSSGASGARTLTKAGPDASDAAGPEEGEQPNDPAEPQNLVPGGSKAAMITFWPQLAAAKYKSEALTEVVLVMDRSGSMRKNMASAKAAMRLFVSSLPEGTPFNIVGFGSRFECMWPVSQGFSDLTKAMALRYIDASDANMGGTAISQPLRYVFGNERVLGTRQVVLVTDGQVRNTREVVELVRARCGARGSAERVFTLGIGASVSHALVKGVAEAGGGDAEFVVEGERLQPKVMHHLRRILAPTLSNIRVDWGALALLGPQAPAKVPAVFDGERVLLFARLAPDSVAGDVTLSADGPDGRESWTVRVDPNSENIVTGTLVHTCGARAMIADLEAQSGTSSGATTGAGAGAGAGAGSGASDAASCRAAAIALATTHNIASRDTAFIAVERRSEQSRREALAAARPASTARMSIEREAIVDDEGAGAGNVRRLRQGSLKFKSKKVSSSRSSSSSSVGGGGVVSASLSSNKRRMLASVSSAPAANAESRRSRRGSPTGDAPARPAIAFADPAAFASVEEFNASLPPGVGFAAQATSRPGGIARSRGPAPAGRHAAARKIDDALHMVLSETTVKPDYSRAPVLRGKAAEEHVIVDGDDSESAAVGFTDSAGDEHASVHRPSAPVEESRKHQGVGGGRGRRRGMGVGTRAKPDTSALFGKGVDAGAGAGAASASPEALLTALASMQRAAGSWGPEVCDALGVAGSVVADLAAALGGVAESVASTLLVVAALRKRCAALHDEWELLVDKAMRWVRKAGATVTLPDDAEAQAAAML